jgi:hypothetical protein
MPDLRSIKHTPCEAGHFPHHHTTSLQNSKMIMTELCNSKSIAKFMYEQRELRFSNPCPDERAGEVEDPVNVKTILERETIDTRIDWNTPHLLVWVLVHVCCF